MKHNFRDLGIWKDSFAIVKDVYDLCTQLPSEEKYGLKSQIQRCAISIPSNIAEGSGRTSDKEFLHFLNIAISSSYELETQLLLCNEIFAIDVDFIIEKLHINQRMIGGLKRKINALK
ncbi:MAG: four helix bundle protein [Crocinitomicaceae bacterium]|nr:four helix bundle protein [Crocinitomicaceae bacterium]